ncbi:MAG: hypothetical protein OER90_05195 [Gemmatimonadota bacterium]|nr:hypothetical protein [Gemmatimonadota bacterium]
MRTAVVLGALLLLTAQALDAQRARVWAGRRGVGRPAVELGIRTGYDFDVDAVLVGAQLRLPIGPTIEVVPSADYYFVSDGTAWQVNADVMVRTGFLQLLYGGVGGALTHRPFTVSDFTVPDDTKWGLNLSAGVSTPRFLPWRVRPYAEARWTFVSEYDTQFAIVGGANLRW